MKIILRLVAKTEGASRGVELVVAESPSDKTSADRDRVFAEVKRLLSHLSALRFVKMSTMVFVIAPLARLTPSVVEAVRVAFDEALRED